LRLNGETKTVDERATIEELDLAVNEYYDGVE
jgi:hypothetical protein